MAKKKKREKTDRQVACPYCHRTFKNKAGLSGHIRLKHSNEERESEGKEETPAHDERTPRTTESGEYQDLYSAAKDVADTAREVIDTARIGRDFLDEIIDRRMSDGGLIERCLQSRQERNKRLEAVLTRRRYEGGPVIRCARIMSDTLQDRIQFLANREEEEKE